MVSNPIGKSFIRQKLKSSIILLLLTVASFFFINNFIQLVTINSQIEQAAGFYKSIGKLNAIDEEKYNVTKGIELIRASDDIAFIDNRSGVQGIIKDFNSAYIGEDIPKFTDTQTATLTDVYFIATVKQIISNDAKEDDLPSYIIAVDVEENIAGFEEYAKEGYRIFTGIDYEDHNISFTGEYYTGEGFERNDQVMNAYYLQAGYTFITNLEILKSVQPYGKYDYWDRDADSDEDAEFTNLEAGINFNLNSYARFRLAYNKELSKPESQPEKPDNIVIRLQADF